MVQIRQSWICWGIAAIPALFAAPEIGANYSDSLESSRQVRSEERTDAQDRAEQVRYAQSVKADSAVALERIKSSCIAVVYRSNGLPAYLAEGFEIKAGPDSDKPLGDGALVCTELGDTGKVRDGRVVDVRRASVDDKEEYLSFFNRL